MKARVHKIALVLLALATLGAGASTDRSRSTASLADLRGTVVDLSTVAAEGDLDVVAVVLEGESRTDTVLLGPKAVLDDLGFEVEVGDRMRVRVFVDGEDGGPLSAQRVLNLSRQSMMRLRTLHRDPLWDAAGRWQGSTFGRGPDPERARSKQDRPGADRGGR